MGAGHVGRWQRRKKLTASLTHAATDTSRSRMVEHHLGRGKALEWARRVRGNLLFAMAHTKSPADGFLRSRFLLPR